MTYYYFIYYVIKNHKEKLLLYMLSMSELKLIFSGI